MPEGMPAFRKPINKGIEEQEQKGVTEPNMEEIKFPTPKGAFSINAFILEVGKKVLIKATTKTTTNIKSSILVKL